MKLQDSQIARVCRGISLLLHGGIFLSDGLHLLAGEEPGELGPLLADLVNTMDQGRPLSQAMEQTQAFPEHVSRMAAVGEKTGRLEQAMESLAVFYEERERTARQIKTALTYPALILVLMLGVIAVLLIRVLPVFDRVYISLGSRLTGLGAGLLALGQGMKNLLLPVLILVLLALLAAGLYRKNPAFRGWVASLFHRYFGDWGCLKLFNNARCARALALGLHSGLPMEEALSLARELVQDVPQAARRCEICLAAIAAGESFAQALGKAGLLPQSQSQLLLVGLRSGAGDQVMETIAQRMTEEAQAALEETVAKIEPAMVMVCAALVGIILLSVMLPLMDILTAIG